MKTRARSALLLVASLLLALAGARAQVPVTISVPAIDVGYYDAFGEHDTRIQEGLNGVVNHHHPRWPARGFMVFEIPAFPGTLTGAVIRATSRSYGLSGSPTLLLHEVTNTASVVRQGTFSATDVYADLGDGMVFASKVMSYGYDWSSEIVFEESNLSALLAARGDALVLGTSSGHPGDFVAFPSASWDTPVLNLQILAPHQPTIYTQPMATYGLSNDAVVAVGACGAEPLGYHWFANGTNYQNAAHATFGWLSGDFPVHVVVSNAYGAVTSVVTQVRRQPARIIFWDSTNVAVRSGSFTSLPFFQSAFEYPTTLRWLKDGAPFTSVNSHALTFSDPQPSDRGTYTAVVSNSWGVATSAVMRLDVVDVAPRFWAHPRSRTNAAGEQAWFEVNAPAGPLAVLRWFRDGVFLSSSTGTVSTLQLPAVTTSDAGSYYVVASNHAGVVTSAVAHLTVKLDPPFFTTQPRSQVSYPGRSVDFTIVAGGTPIPSLQWFRDGSPIPNARRPMFRLLSVTPQDAGAYFCVASNASGMATSAVANLEVLLVPPVLSGPADRSAPAGNVLVLNLTISNPPASVAWFANGAPAQFSGYSGSSPGEPATIGLWVTLGRSNHTAQYFAVASNEFGMSTSRTASITVTTAPPVFLAQPTNVTVLEGSTIFISTWAVGAPPPRFLLHRDGQPVEAFSEYNGLRLLNVTPSHSGEYVLVATNEAGTASSMPFQISVHRAGPLDKWTRVHPMPQGNDLHAIAFGGGRYVACGDAGAVITSTDGTNWSVFFADAPAELQGVTHGNGRYVAVGRFASEAIVVTSSDGERWSTHRVPEAERLRGVAFGQGQFVAVGREQFSSTARAYSSADGTNWSEVVVGSASANFEAVAFANGRWVIAVDGGRAYSSTDLSTWTNVTTGMLKPEGAAFINNQFVITGDDGVIAFSSDGLNWIAHTNHPSERRLHNTAHHGGLYVTAGARGNIFTSSTLQAFPWALANSPTPNRLEDVLFANGLFVAVGENGTILTSPDGQQWVDQTRGVTEDLDDLAVMDDIAIAVGKSGTILASTDGLTWALSSSALAVSRGDWHGVGFGDGKIVVVGQTNHVLVSTDTGSTWTAHPYSASASYLKSVTYANGRWVAAGVGGVILTSRNATNWTQQTSTTTGDLNDVAYGNGFFVVVGDQVPSPNATILVSADGTNWLNRSYPLSKNARAVTFQQERFLIAANDGRFLSSAVPPYQSWYPSLSPLESNGDNNRDVTAHSRIWVAVGNQGIIVTAPTVENNGIGIWKARLSRTVENLHAVRYFKGAFLAVGNRGLILRSGLLEPRLGLEREGGNLRLIFSSPHEGPVNLQSSPDLNWQSPTSTPLFNSVGTVDVLVPAADAKRFFRIVP